MGQRIEIEGTTILGDSAIFATDRGLTGMDGFGYDDPAVVEDDDRFPARLARRIFEADDAVTRVFVSSGDVVVTRSGGWDASSRAHVAGVIEAFFLYY